MVKNMEDTLIQGFKDIARDLEDFSYKINLRDLEYKLSESRALSELKVKNGLSGLRFFKDELFLSYLCATDEDCNLLNGEDLSSIEIADTQSFYQLLSKTQPSVKFISTGKTYDNLNDLKKDYLTLKLSGV